MSERDGYALTMPTEPMSSAELRSLLRTADRSGGWLARQIGVTRQTVRRWRADGVPDKHAARVRELLPPSKGEILR
jgi:DNA-binding transcriptional regulator YiaG